MRRFAWILLVAASSCTRPAPPAEHSPPSLPSLEAVPPEPPEPPASSEPLPETVEARPSSEEDAGMPPLAAKEPYVDLEVPGFAPAVVYVPLGATTPRPILVATHGNYDRPDWQCFMWGPVAKEHAFVLCPRGIPRRDSPSKDDVRWEYATNMTLEKELFAAIDALKARFPGYVDDRAMVYTGFSLGAIMGAAIAKRHPDRFPRLVLIEGGESAWPLGAAKQLHEKGGERILFACGQPGCVSLARTSAASLEKAGVAARVVYGEKEGHSYFGKVEKAFKEAFPWVVEGDARWAAH